MNRTAAASAALAVVVGSLALSAEPATGATPQTLRAYTTAYDYWDNTPAGSTEISHPVLHKRAGGTGTYADPVTLAVGHSLITATRTVKVVDSKGRPVLDKAGKQTTKQQTYTKDVLDVAAGTRFYFPDLRKYAMVEDTCGDGKKPQTIPCHRLDYPSNKAPKGAQLWVDLWAGGDKNTSKKVSAACMSKITDGNGAVHTIIKNPAATYLVEARPILQGTSCRANYGNTALKR